MGTYKLKFERTQRGKKLDWSNEIIVTCTIPPKVGDGKALLVDPPIHETIVSVEEIKDVNITEEVEKILNPPYANTVYTWETVQRAINKAISKSSTIIDSIRKPGYYWCFNNTLFQNKSWLIYYWDGHTFWNDGDDFREDNFEQIDEKQITRDELYNDKLIVKISEMLEPMHKNSTFTWNQIYDAIDKIVKNKDSKIDNDR